MFVVSVYSFLDKEGNCVHYYEFTNVFDALNCYYSCLEKYSKEEYGVLMYTSNGNIIHGF